jgi:hypothetical protein
LIWVRRDAEYFFEWGRTGNGLICPRAEFELPSKKLSCTVMATAWLYKRGLVALLKAMKPLEEDLPETGDPVA